MFDIPWIIHRESWAVLGDMAPYLLFGFAVAGILSIAISPAWIERHLGGRGWRPIAKAALWGVPLPLCSCGVIPVAASLRRHGASRAATTAFLLSTPQTGVDGIAVTYALLGPVFAIFRPLAALVSGLLGGLLVLWFGATKTDSDPANTPSPCTEECCSTNPTGNWLTRALHHGFITLPRDLAGSLLLGVVLAGAMAALCPKDHLHALLGGGVVSILLMMAVGIPLYVCATASVPIAVGLMHMGASPGAALAFLIAGPATNAATITTIWKILGRRPALLYLVSVAASAVVCGLALDWITGQVAPWLPRVDQHVHEMAEGGWWSSIWAVALLGILGASWLTGLWARGRTPSTQPSRGAVPASPASPENALGEIVAAHKSCCCHEHGHTA